MPRDITPNGLMENENGEILFGHSVRSEATPKDVAKHIRAFVKAKRTGAWDRKVAKAIKELTA